MNTAQCVIEGREPENVRDSPIGSMLRASIAFAIFAGAIFSLVIVDMRKINRLSGRKIKNTVTAMCVSIHFLSVLCTLYFFVACGLTFRNISYFDSSLILAFVIIWSVVKSFLLCKSMRRFSFSYVNCKRGVKAIFCLLYSFGGNAICYISC